MAFSIVRFRRIPLRWFAVLSAGIICITFIYEIWPEKPEGKALKQYDGLKGVIHKTSNLRVHYWHKGDLFASRGMSVFRSKDQGITWVKMAEIGRRKGSIVTKIQHFIGRLKLVLKLRDKSGITRLRIFQNDIILATYGGVYRGTLSEREIINLENTYTWRASPLVQGWTQDNNGNIYAGEYIGKGHNFTYLYFSPDQGESWNITYKFPRQEVRHIHFVDYDPYRNLLWVTTGDLNHESRILYSNDYGSSFQTFGSGNQDWRAVSLQFTSKAIYWGSDKANNNHLFRWDWETEHKEVLLTVDNPFYYSIADEMGNLYFATTVERTENNNSTSQYSEIWEIPFDSKTPLRHIAWQKGSLKQFGKIEFAQGDSPPGWIAFTPINLKGHHYETLVMKVKDNINPLH